MVPSTLVADSFLNKILHKLLQYSIHVFGDNQLETKM